MTPDLSACFHRKEEEVVQSGWSSWGPTEPQAWPCRVPAQTEKQLHYHLQLCVQPNEWQCSRLPCDRQQHTSLCCLLTGLRSCEQIIPSVAASGSFSSRTLRHVRRTLQTYSQPLNLYSTDCLKADLKLILNELQQCQFFSMYIFPGFFFLIIHMQA